MAVMQGEDSPRRTIRFGLSALFIAIAVCSLACWLGVGWHTLGRRDQELGMLRARGVLVGSALSEPKRAMPWNLRLWRAARIELIDVPDGLLSRDELANLGRLFPEATIRGRERDFD